MRFILFLSIMTKQQYLQLPMSIGFYPNQSLGGGKEKLNPLIFTMEYRGHAFDFEVYTSKHSFTENCHLMIVVAEGIDFYSKIDSIYLFGSHSYVEASEAYRVAILQYCKKYDLQICESKGDSPIAWVTVQPASGHHNFKKEVETY